MGAIDWGVLTQPVYDNTVETFFLAENSDLSDDAYAVNGRGGDEGIDLLMRRDGKLTVVQLKFFPEGFSGGFAKTRRAQIRDSFKSALKHEPDEWWLVVPTTLTTAERRYVLELPGRQTPKLTTPKVVIFDRPQLDALAAKHPDLVGYVQRDGLLEAAKVYNQEQALLINKDGLLARVAALSKQADTLHDDWRLDFFTDGDIIGTTLVAKNAYAAERSPVTMTLHTTFGPDHEDLRTSFERAMSYGTPDRIDLPPSVVSKFTVDGPAFLAQDHDDASEVSVSLLPTAPAPVGQPVSLVFYNDRDAPVASFPGKTTWTGAAHEGVSVRAVFFNAITLEFLIPFDTATAGGMSINLTFHDRDPADVVRAITLIEQLEQAPSMGLEIDGVQVAKLLTHDRPTSMFGDDQSEIAAHRDIAADLVAVQQATNRHFTYPETIEFKDRVYLRFLRLLLDGECVVLPDKRQVTVTLNGEDNPTSRSLLSGEDIKLIVEHDNFGVEVFGHDIFVGHARIFVPRASALDPAAAFTALGTGSAAGRKVSIRAADGYGFWVFLPERRHVPDDQPLRPASLGLNDFTDAPDVARAGDAAEPADAEA